MMMESLRLMTRTMMMTEGVHSDQLQKGIKAVGLQYQEEGEGDVEEEGGEDEEEGGEEVVVVVEEEEEEEGGVIPEHNHLIL